MNRGDDRNCSPIVSRRSACAGFLCGLSLVVAAGLFAPAEEPAAGEAIVTDVDGKEYTLSKLKFTTGTRRLAWLADPQGHHRRRENRPARPRVPRAELDHVRRGVITLVPVASIESAKYDYEKQAVSLTVRGLSSTAHGHARIQGDQRTWLQRHEWRQDGVFTGGVLSKTAVKASRSAARGDREIEGRSDLEHPDRAAESR